jgi:hypothetical protein
LPEGGIISLANRTRITRPHQPVLVGERIHQSFRCLGVRSGASCCAAAARTGEVSSLVIVLKSINPAPPKGRSPSLIEANFGQSLRILQDLHLLFTRPSPDFLFRSESRDVHRKPCCRRASAAVAVRTTSASGSSSIASNFGIADFACISPMVSAGGGGRGHF